MVTVTRKEFWDKLSLNDFNCYKANLSCFGCHILDREGFYNGDNNQYCKYLSGNKENLNKELFKNDYKLYMEEQINKLW